MNGLTLLGDPCIRVSILKCCSARSRHEAAWPQRFVFPPIQIDLPSAQSPASIDNFPARAAEDPAYVCIRCVDNDAVTQAALVRLCGSGKTRDENAAASRRPRGKTK